MVSRRAACGLSGLDKGLGTIKMRTAGRRTKTPADARVFGGGGPSVPSGAKNGQNFNKNQEKRAKNAKNGLKMAVFNNNGPKNAKTGLFSLFSA